MKIIIGIILFVTLVIFLLNRAIRKKVNNFEIYYQTIQENTIKEANKILNSHLMEYSRNPSDDMFYKIFEILNSNQSYVILTFLSNNDRIDDGTSFYSNSINVRKIKNGEIATFTDFDLMRKYVSVYSSTEIIKTHDFIKLCEFHEVKTIIFNFNLPNPYILSNENKTNKSS